MACVSGWFFLLPLTVGKIAACYEILPSLSSFSVSGWVKWADLPFIMAKKMALD